MQSRACTGYAEARVFFEAVASARPMVAWLAKKERVFCRLLPSPQGEGPISVAECLSPLAIVFVVIYSNSCIPVSSYSSCVPPVAARRLRRFLALRGCSGALRRSCKECDQRSSGLLEYYTLYIIRARGAFWSFSCQCSRASSLRGCLQRRPWASWPC